MASYDFSSVVIGEGQKKVSNLVVESLDVQESYTYKKKKKQPQQLVQPAYESTNAKKESEEPRYIQILSRILEIYNTTDMGKYSNGRVFEELFSYLPSSDEGVENRPVAKRSLIVSIEIYIFMIRNKGDVSSMTEFINSISGVQKLLQLLSVYKNTRIKNMCAILIALIYYKSPVTTQISSTVIPIITQLLIEKTKQAVAITVENNGVERLDDPDFEEEEDVDDNLYLLNHLYSFALTALSGLAKCKNNYSVLLSYAIPQRNSGTPSFLPVLYSFALHHDEHVAEDAINTLHTIIYSIPPKDSVAKISVLRTNIFSTILPLFVKGILFLFGGSVNPRDPNSPNYIPAAASHYCVSSVIHSVIYLINSNVAGLCVCVCMYV
jgi:hypothetical protein